MKLRLLICLLMLLSGSVMTLTAAEIGSDWTVPDCDRIGGTSALTFTTDGFLSVAETSTLRKTVWTHGLAALEEPNTLVAAAWSDGEAILLISEDAGCKWRRLGDIYGCGILTFAMGPAGTFYAWSSSRADFYRIQGKEITVLTAPDVVLGMAVDPRDAMHIRIGSSNCQLYESNNGGEDFFKVGETVYTGVSSIFTVDFDPQNWDCALCGTKGAYRTVDGGQSWARIAPFDLEDDDIVYRFVFSPVDSRRVWARAKLETSLPGPRGIFVSDDGGATFSMAAAESTLVVDQNGIGRYLLLQNIPTMAAHPRNADVVYFVYGNAYPSFDNYGTDFYTYDAATNAISLVHNDVLDGIGAIAFNPADPTVMYLGLENQYAGITVSKVGGDQPTESVKLAVMPNPFNPSTEVSFSLPEAAQVKLNIYNMVGQKVATVVDAYLSAGEHTVAWDASRFASGIYLARLEAGSSVETKKMVLLK